MYLAAVVNSEVFFSTFDPISVLASLAFLAFLLQSFASLYDRSRSILPTIVSGRRQSSDVTIPEISRHVSRALRDYVSMAHVFGQKSADRIDEITDTSLFQESLNLDASE